jgi:hypothetical protein
MSREPRLDFQGAIHFVQIRGHHEGAIFLTPDRPQTLNGKRISVASNAHSFLFLLNEAREEYGALLHGYSIVSNAAGFLLQRLGAPLEWLMRDVHSQFSLRIREKQGLQKGQTAFGGRYKSQIVSPTYLPHVLRRLHRIDSDMSSPEKRRDYPFSSDAAYLRGHGPTWLTMTAVQAALEHRGYIGIAGYTDFMQKPETPYVAALLTNGWRADRRVIGDKQYVGQASRAAKSTPRCPSRDELVCAVSGMVGVCPRDIYTRTHVASLGRALVAWYAARTGAATHAEVGRWFNISGSALRHAIRYHREKFPNHFNQSFENLFAGVAA